MLVALYANMLQDDMKNSINSAINVWKDPTKDVSGNNDKYIISKINNELNLPWIPMRLKSNTG